MRIINKIKWIKEKILGSKSYALDDLDLKLKPFLNFEEGVFVEAGANDGIKQSNTLYFEKHKGWTGLLIEPIPSLAEKCQKNRPKCLVEQAALVADDYRGDTVKLRYCDLMSVVKGGLESEKHEVEHVQKGSRFLEEDEEVYEVSAPARTLTSILNEYELKSIDLLSLDIEGYEPQALKGLNFNIYRPEYILVEVREKVNIEKVIGDHYIHIENLTNHNNRKDMLFRSKK